MILSSAPHRLARNSAWNLLGQVIPLIVALISIPVLIRHMGTERFGILTIVWMVTGYFGLFDFGLGRALTQMVAEKMAHSLHQEVVDVIQTVTAMMFLLGSFAAVVLKVTAPLVVGRFLKVPDSLIDETLNSVDIVAVTIPFVLAATALRGALEAVHQFALANLMRIPIVSLSYLLPMLVMYWSNRLDWVVGSILLMRIVGFLAHGYWCKKIFTGLKFFGKIKFHLVGPLLRYGSWMTVSNLISPIMAQMDRFYIGTVISMNAVAYYATPFEMVSKVNIIPAAITGVLFPSLASILVKSKEEASENYNRGQHYIILAMFPFLVLTILFAHEGLQIWLGAEFSQQSSMVLQILAFGYLVNGIATVPYTLLQAAGRPDITAKLHAAELPFFIFLLWSLTHSFGINGTAWAWTIRVIADCILLLILAQKILPNIHEKLRLGYLALGAGVVTAAAGISTLPDWPVKLLAGLIFVAGFAWLTYQKLLGKGEREKLLSLVLRRTDGEKT